MRTFCFYWCFMLSILYSFGSDKAPEQLDNYISTYKDALKFLSDEPGKAILMLKTLVEDTNDENDSIALLSCIQLSKVQGLRQHFEDAFEYTIQGLLIAKKRKDSLRLASINGELGVLYDEFGKEKKARFLLETSLDLYKKLHKKNKINRAKVSKGHFGLAMHYRKYAAYDLALAHLDTCSMISKAIKKPLVYSSYHRAEQAAIYIEKGITKEALSILEDIEKRIEERLHDPDFTIGLKGYLTIIYTYKGDAYAKMKMYKKAIQLYKKSLEHNKEYKRHNSNNSETLEKVAKLYGKLGNHKEAFIYLSKSKEIADAFFGVKSKKNSSFIEITSKYHKKIKEQEVQLKKQEYRILRFQIIVFVLLLVGVVGFLLVKNRTQKQRFSAEKAILHEKERESQQALKDKNKELTAFTLKFIEKEKVIQTLSEELKEKAAGDRVTLAKLKTLQIDSKALWEEFNSRFVKVNEGFYERLKNRFPKLTPTERKHCALIKLNFSGKQMAHLLNITEHSVHVSRYRLRKKMNLEKSDNLVEFISKI